MLNRLMSRQVLDMMDNSPQPDASGIMRIESFAQTVIMANDVNTRVQVCGKKKKDVKGCQAS